nr:GIY-YIG nuclease family protein [uncultured Butyrivibrio sp.]
MVITFTDIIKKAGLDPAKVKLIRHSLTNRNFRKCYEKGFLYEYTCHQKQNFSKGYDYWAVFLSGKSTQAKFISLYKVEGSVPDTKNLRPAGMPECEKYNGELAVFKLVPSDLLKEYEQKLTIEWGNAAISWHQKGTTEKEILSFQADRKSEFSGYEDLVLSYDELKEIIENDVVYESWHTALSSIYAIYLIVDKETGKQYVGSAYNVENGLLGRWREYVSTYHGGNKRIVELIKEYPNRYHSFQFSILQILPKTLDPDTVIDIENRYKHKLLSKEFGLNDN